MAIKGGSIKAHGSGGPSISVGIHIAGLEKTSQEFKDARKDMNARLRDAVERAGKREALPYITAKMRSEIGHRWASSMKVKRDRTTVFVSSSMRGQMNRALGWLNFGGKRPRDTQYRHGREVMVSTLQERRSQIDTVLLEELMKAFDGLEHSP